MVRPAGISPATLGHRGYCGNWDRRSTLSALMVVSRPGTRLNRFATGRGPGGGGMGYLYDVEFAGHRAGTNDWKDVRHFRGGRCKCPLEFVFFTHVRLSIPSVSRPRAVVGHNCPPALTRGRRMADPCWIMMGLALLERGALCRRDLPDQLILRSEDLRDIGPLVLVVPAGIVGTRGGKAFWHEPVTRNI